MSGFQPIKCEGCGRVPTHITKELPKIILLKYPDGLCRDCKRSKIKRLVGLVK